MRFNELETISGADYQKNNPGEVAKLGAQVGHHHYYQLGVFEAVDRVGAACPHEWKAGYAHAHDTVPADMLAHRVGQVRVRHGDPSFVLYIWRDKYENENKRLRQVRDALNKCKNHELIERIGKLLNV